MIRRWTRETWVSLLAGAGVLAWLLWTTDGAGTEAVVSEHVCREVLRKTTEGRQALVSSWWWPPLLFLLRLPFVALTGAGDGGWNAVPVASLMLGAAGAAAGVMVVWRAARRWGWPPAVALPATLAWWSLPGFRAGARGGAVLPVIVAIALFAAYALGEWARGRGVRYLVYFAFAVCGLIGLSVEGGLWAGLAMLLFGAHLLLMPGPRDRRGAAAWLAWLPPVYALALWLILNWLIMGDPLYAWRPLALRSTWPDPAALAPAAPPGADRIFMAVSLVVAGLGIVRRDRGGVWLGLLGAAPYGLLPLLAGLEWLWDDTPLRALGRGVVVMAVLHAGRRADGVSSTGVAVESGARPARTAWWALGMLLAVAAWQARAPVAPARAAGSAVAGPDDWAAAIERHVRLSRPHPRVFVCGHAGYTLMGPQTADDIFVHALDFNLDVARRDYRGQTLYVLVHGPFGRERRDNIHRKLPELYLPGLPGLLYDGDWGPWRLFELVMPPAAPLVDPLDTL